MSYKRQELLFGLVLLAIGLFLGIHTFDATYTDMAQDIHVGPMFVPRIVIAVWIICSLGIIVQSFQASSEAKLFVWGRIGCALVVLCGFALLFNKIGFILSGTGCFIGLGWILGFRSPLRLASIALGYVVLVSLLFKWGLNIYLPTFGASGV